MLHISAVDENKDTHSLIFFFFAYHHKSNMYIQLILKYLGTPNIHDIERRCWLLHILLFFNLYQIIIILHILFDLLKEENPCRPKEETRRGCCLFPPRVCRTGFKTRPPFSFSFLSNFTCSSLQRRLDHPLFS